MLARVGLLEYLASVEMTRFDLKRSDRNSEEARND